MSKTADILVVGAGPGGIAAAIKAAEAGKSYVVIEMVNSQWLIVNG